MSMIYILYNSADRMENMQRKDHSRLIRQYFHFGWTSVSTETEEDSWPSDLQLNWVAGSFGTSEVPIHLRKVLKFSQDRSFRRAPWARAVLPDWMLGQNSKCWQEVPAYFKAGHFIIPYPGMVKGIAHEMTIIMLPNRSQPENIFPDNSRNLNRRQSWKSHRWWPAFNYITFHL